MCVSIGETVFSSFGLSRYVAKWLLLQTVIFENYNGKEEIIPDRCHGFDLSQFLCDEQKSENEHQRLEYFGCVRLFQYFAKPAQTT